MVHKVYTKKEYGIFDDATIDEPWVKKSVYELYGIVTHSGSMSGGHYVAYVCYWYNGERYWFYFSDSSYRKVKESTALSAEAYILFYKLIT